MLLTLARASVMGGNAEMNIAQIARKLQMHHHDAPPRTPGIIRFTPPSIDAASASAVKRFDHNGDGAVDIAESRSSSNPNISYFRKPLHQSSIERMVRGADLLTGNGDGRATKEEIAALMRTFDVGSDAVSPILANKGGFPRAKEVAGDGKLTGSELRNFNQSFGETFTNHSPGRLPRLPHILWNTGKYPLGQELPAGS